MDRWSPHERVQYAAIARDRRSISIVVRAWAWLMRRTNLSDSSEESTGMVAVAALASRFIRPG
jgi:hypothetical protein